MAGEQRSFLILSRPPPDSNFQRRKFTSNILLRLHISLDAIRVKWSSQPKKAKSLPCVPPGPLAAPGVTRSLADSAGSAGHGEKKESLLDVSVKSDRLRQSTWR
jgi:hypothetical protein